MGLRVDPVSTQIVQRDRHAALLAAIAILGGTLERMATEVRNLQHTEIAEVMEPFRRGQKGSSAMPHKRNPILSERLAGLARLLRGYAQTGFENQPLWHERDISHSSAERVILPDATILLDYMLVKATGLVEGLIVRPERMLENIERGLGLHASSRVLVALVEKGGLSREEAYAIVQRNALRAADERVPFHGLLATDPSLAQRLPLSRARRLLRRRRGPAPRAGGAGAPRRLEAAIGRRSRDLGDGSTAAAGAGRRPAPPCRDGGDTWRTLRLCSCARARSATCIGSTTSRLLLVASDRLSAFDVVMPTPHPRQGPGADRAVEVLVPADRGHRAQPPGRAPIRQSYPMSWRRPWGRADELRGRMMIGRLADVLPVECVVRGYLSGSGWKEYQADGSVCGIVLPAGLRESDRLPEPIFTPAWKAPAGVHDENIAFDAGGGAGRVRSWRRAVRDGVAGPVPAWRGGLRTRRDHPGRHEVRVRRAARPASCCSSTRS